MKFFTATFILCDRSAIIINDQAISFNALTSLNITSIFFPAFHGHPQIIIYQKQIVSFENKTITPGNLELNDRFKKKTTKNKIIHIKHNEKSKINHL